jgi:hypothetical protein
MKTQVLHLLAGILTLAFCAPGTQAQGIKNNGAFITGSSGSYLSFNGSGNAYYEDTCATCTSLDNLVVDFSSTSYKLTIPDNTFITTNNLIVGDSIHLKASSSGMASLITNGTISGSPIALVEQYLAGSQWHLIGSPMSNARAKTYLGMYLKSFDEPTNTWSWITAPNTLLTVGKGYAVYNASNATAKFKGFLNTGDKSPTVSYNAGPSGGDGWNLLGNPYPSPLEWNNNWTKSSIDATVYVFDGTQYLTWNYNLGGFGTMGNGYIPSTQGFWVKANATGPSITIPNSERLHVSQAFYKDVELFSNLMTINVAGNGYTDNALVGFYSGATDKFDSDFDAYKLAGIPAAPQLYTILEDEMVSVNILGTLAGSKQVPLNLEVGANTSYVMTFNNVSTFDPDISIYLEDKALSAGSAKMINLRTTSTYTVKADSTDDPSRFVLHFGKIDNDENLSTDGGGSGIQIYAYQSTVYVKYPSDARGEAVIYTLMGQELTRRQLEANTINTINLTCERGYYLVRVISGNEVLSQKVRID